MRVAGFVCVMHGRSLCARVSRACPGMLGVVSVRVMRAAWVCVRCCVLCVVRLVCVSRVCMAHGFGAFVWLVGGVRVGVGFACSFPLAALPARSFSPFRSLVAFRSRFHPLAASREFSIEM